MRQLAVRLQVDRLQVERQLEEKLHQAKNQREVAKPQVVRLLVVRLLVVKQLEEKLHQAKNQRKVVKPQVVRLLEVLLVVKLLVVRPLMARRKNLRKDQKPQVEKLPEVKLLVERCQFLVERLLMEKTQRQTKKPNNRLLNQHGSLDNQVVRPQVMMRLQVVMVWLLDLVITKRDQIKNQLVIQTSLMPLIIKV